jgi:hypothetical protein
MAKAHLDGRLLKKVQREMNFKLKINVIWKYLELHFYPTKLSVGLPNLLILSH